MNVSGISGAQATTGISPSTWSGASRPSGGSGATGRMQAAIGAAAQLLNTPPSDLARQLGIGTSLSSIASAAGISSQTLMTAVSKGVAGAVPQGSQPLSSDLLQTVSSRIIQSTSVPAGFSARQLG
jgi:hypothetical protein